MTKKKKLSYYAVLKGYNPGIYQSWEECKNQVAGFPNNEYKGFTNLVEAEEYLKSPGGRNCGRGWNADKNLLAKNSNQLFSEFSFTAERTSLRKSTCENGLLVDNTSLKDSQSSEVKAEDCFDYLPLESMPNEPCDQQRHGARFSSFSEMCKLLCDNLACAVNLSDIYKPAFLLHERVRHLKSQVNLIDDDDDDDSQLLDFASESHLYKCLGLEKDKDSTTFMDERYFNSAYKLEFAATSEGNPGKSGAGIVLRRPDGSVIFKLMAGLGTMVKALADFHAFILGLRASLDRGIYHIEVSGQFTPISGSQEYLSDKDATNLEKEADALFNTFKLLLVKRKANVCITASSLAKEAVGLPGVDIISMVSNEYLKRILLLNVSGGFFDLLTTILSTSVLQMDA